MRYVNGLKDMATNETSVVATITLSHLIGLSARECWFHSLVNLGEWYSLSTQSSFA